MTHITTTSPAFIRLHFYPTSYQKFDAKNALFSVQVNNNLTLLKDFSPSLWIRDDDDEKLITKEYCNYVFGFVIKPKEKLNITFIPNNINQSNDYYAFVNAIEVVSMPYFLYYTDLYDTNYHFKLLDSDNEDYQILNDKALEMVYRVNVGDNQVPSSADTGMFRYWDNDYPRYLEKQYPQYPLSVSTGFEFHLDYKNNSIPNYTAPEVVYLTARSYGRDVKEDYSVTWNFEVDYAFTYMVRLHFCEFDYKIKNKGDRVFQIFINDVMAEQGADVIYWSGGNMVPVHKDYAVPMYSQEGSFQIERVTLSIKLHRVPEYIYTKYRDVLLNGIEILKISDISNNLAGAIPKFRNLSEKHKTPKTLVIVVVVVSGLVLTIVMCITIFWVRKRFPDFMKDDLSKIKNEGSSSVPPHLCRYFTIAEINAATNNFDDSFIIGLGGFGNVYKGIIDGSTPVAIKRLKQGSQQGANEFMNEIELLSQLRHINLVSLVGYCNDSSEMVLVYEFMQHGTLGEYLYGSNKQPLPWKQRLEILLAIEQIVDPFLRDSITGDCLKCYCELALSCLHEDGTQRPSMNQVVVDLEFALHLVVSEEGRQFDKTQKDVTHMKRSQFSQTISDDESCLHYARSHTYKESTVSARPDARGTIFLSY